mgnify:CR=1 FL=1
MLRLFKHYIPYPVLFLGFIDFVLLLMAAAVLVLVHALVKASGRPGASPARSPHAEGAAG